MSRDEWWNLDWSRMKPAFDFAGYGQSMDDRSAWVDAVYCYGGMCL